MKAITICNPHAWAVIHGSKMFENRTWRSSFSGTLLIHAGQSVKFMSDRDMYPGCPDPMDPQMVFGAIIGVVDMYGSKRPGLEDARYHGYGPWCHVYANPRPLPRPIKCRGMQGLWTPPAKVLAAVYAQMPDVELGEPALC
jgi:hypothetical protein